MTTRDKLDARVQAVGSILCVGLDLGPHTADLLTPEYDNPGRLNRHLIDITHPFAAAYKFQLAGYLAMGIEGMAALRTSVEYLRTAYPQIPILLDAKMNDIAHSLENYAHFAFDYLGVDAVTANPMLGQDANQPLLERTDKLVYFLASTTNPGSAEFQGYGEPPLYLHIAERVSEWGGAAALVVGATHADRVAAIRKAAPQLPFLIPGLGAQGGQASAFLAPARGPRPADALVNASRSIMRADDPATAAEGLAALLRS